MTIRSLFLAGAALGLAFAPVAALADLQITADGFHRVVATSTQGDTCSVQRITNGRAVTCPDGSRGTLLIYQHRGDQSPVCEVDFWYAGNGSGAQRWRAQVSHANGAAACAVHWNGTNALTISGTT